LGPDYDRGLGNAFLRWLYTDLYFRRTDSFYNLARLAGIAEIVERPGVKAVTGYPVVQHLFSGENLSSALRSQRSTYEAVHHGEGEVTRRISGAATISSSSTLLELSGSNLGVLNDVADLVNLGAPAICFEGECPSGNDAVKVGALTDALPLPGVSHGFQVETAEDYEGHMGGRWVDGRVAYGEAFGAIAEQLGDVAVGIGRAHGSLHVVGAPSRERTEVWLQVLRGPNPVTYKVRCGSREVVVAPPLSLGNYFWTWGNFGYFKHSRREESCEISMSGEIGAVAAGGITQRSGGPAPDVAVPDILVSPAAAAFSWNRAEASSFNYPGVTSTAAIVSNGGSLVFLLPPGASDFPRHVYARVLGLGGTVSIQAEGARPRRHRTVFRTDERKWLGLGELDSAQRKLRLRVTGGRAAVIRIALASPEEMAALAAAGSSRVPVRLLGNTGLETTEDVIVRRTGHSARPAYLIVRAAANGLWFLDRRDADGTYAGYGQIYRIDGSAHVLSSVLRTRMSVGAGLSVGFMVGLVSLAVFGLLRRQKSKRAR
jgi:hypothetical protein